MLLFFKLLWKLGVTSKTSIGNISVVKQRWSSASEQEEQSKSEDGTIIDDIVVDISDPITDPHVKFYQVFWKENSESDYKVIEVEREI